MISNQEPSIDQVLTPTPSSFIFEDNNSSSIVTQTDSFQPAASISLSSPETTSFDDSTSTNDSENDTDEGDTDSNTEVEEIELEAPTSISLSPPETTSLDDIDQDDTDSDTQVEDSDLETPTSISLSPPETTSSDSDDSNDDSDGETEFNTQVEDSDLETPTSISLSPPETTSFDSDASSDDSDGETEFNTQSDSNSEVDDSPETATETDELESPTSISLSASETADNSIVESNDIQGIIAEPDEIEPPVPISLSASPIELESPEPSAIVASSDDISLSVGEFIASSGGKVTVEVAIDNATDLQSLDLDLYYDTEVLDIPDPIPETDINEGVRRTGIAADWKLLAESGDNSDLELPNPIVNVIDDIGDGKTGKVEINLINTSGTPASGSDKIIAIDFQVSDDATSDSIAQIDLREAELGINGQTVNLNDSDSLLKDGNVIVGAGGLDIDGNGVAEPLNDGVLIVRRMFGAIGEGLTNGAIGDGATRTSSAEIRSYLDQIESSLDIDGNGVAEPLNDGVLIVRRLFGAVGEGLTNGAIGSGATRTSPAEIANVIDDLTI